MAASRSRQGVKGVLAGLRQALKSLPSEQERAEIEEACTQLITFLTQLRDRIRQVPTLEGSREVDDALSKLEISLAEAASNRFVATTLGLRKPQPRRPQPVNTAEQLDRAKADLAQLESMPSEEIERRLADESLYSARELRTMASVIGIGSTKGIDRAGLARRIASKIINYRGYRSLGEPVR